ncbi:hypothetical protein V6N13_086877 [Hibiscus sabdariffa]
MCFIGSVLSQLPAFASFKFQAPATTFTFCISSWSASVHFLHFEVVDGDLIDTLQKLPMGLWMKNICLRKSSDLQVVLLLVAALDAIVVGMDMVCSRHENGLESIVVRGRLSQDADKRIMDEIDHLSSIFSKNPLTGCVCRWSNFITGST